MRRWRNKNNLQDVPAQVFYFDEVRIGKTKEKVGRAKEKAIRLVI